MQGYTEEETVILCGFLGRYFDRSAVSESVQRNYTALITGLKRNTLSHKDYLWTAQALQFLMPLWWTEREDHRALEALLLKTQTLVGKSA